MCVPQYDKRICSWWSRGPGSRLSRPPLGAGVQRGTHVKLSARQFLVVPLAFYSPELQVVFSIPFFGREVFNLQYSTYMKHVRLAFKAVLQRC